MNKKCLWMTSCAVTCCLMTTRSFSQTCENFLYLQKNKTIEVSAYNKKGDPSGKQVYQVTDVSNTGSTTTGSLTSELFDKKGKSIAKASSSIQCDGGTMMIDMKMMMPQQQAEQYNNTEAKVQAFYLEYPAALHVGDALKDGNLSMEMTNRGLPQTLTMSITDRKVDAQESVTTAAGTWNCFKISYKNKLTVKTGIIGIPINIDGIEWYSPGFGIVKTESKYGTTAITSIK